MVVVKRSLDESVLRSALSAPRIGTYLRAASGDPALAVALYGWNARMSAALIVPAHFAEVLVRNAVADVLERVYGPRWPWEPAFEQSLPVPRGAGYDARADLIGTRRGKSAAGQVVAELRFVFWQHMFTARNDGRLWDAWIHAAFPNGSSVEPKILRARINADLESIRRLRNRIAHHEPIFARDLGLDLARTLDLIGLRCAATADWVDDLEQASRELARRPELQPA